MQIKHHHLYGNVLRNHYRKVGEATVIEGADYSPALSGVGKYSNVACYYFRAFLGKCLVVVS